MVSKLYKAETFYRKQKRGEVATGLPREKKLFKGKSGYYLNKDGRKEYLKSDDMVYARDSGVTEYSRELDRSIKSSNKRESPKKHKAYAHMYDRETAKGRPVSW